MSGGASRLARLIRGEAAEPGGAAPGAAVESARPIRGGAAAETSATAASDEPAIGAAERCELCGQPVRVTEIAPGLVKTEEFSLVRFGGDQERADAVYAGVPGPLVADDVADCVAWVVTRPWHVNIDSMIVRPRAQAAQHKVHRESPADASRA